MNKKKDYGKEFEEELKDFLVEKLGFEDVKGDNGFHIAPEGESNQVDVAGRYDDILFIFQCKAAGRKVKKSLRDDILSTRERMRIAIKNYKNISEYSKCKLVVPVFITKRIIIPETEKELFYSGKDPKIWYADESLLEYYSELCDKIGKYAVYNFLADFNVKFTKSGDLELLSLKTKFKNYFVYNFFANPKELLKFAYVARRRSTKENFYQRMLEGPRIRKIKQFLDQGGIFPTNIIISLKKGEIEFKKNNDNLSNDIDVGLLRIKNSFNACWIIDGQHRLYSFANSKSDCLVSCLAFENIDIEDERRFFLEINREQRPIKPDLIWDLEGLANPDTKRGKISNIVRTLNNRDPFLDKIYIPVKGSRRGKVVNMAAFCNGIQNAKLTKRITPNIFGKENPLYDDSVKKMTKRCARVLEDYFQLLDRTFDDRDQKDFIFGNAGIPILLYVLEPIVAHINKIPSKENMNKYVLAIENFFNEHYSTTEKIKILKSETTGEGLRNNIAKQMGLHIRKYIRDDSFWPTMEEFDFIKNIIETERSIARFISHSLSEITTSWEKQRVPQSIYRIVKGRMSKDGTDFDENLDLGDECQIITRKDNWDEVFGDILLGSEPGFMNKGEIEIAFNYLSKIRNPKLHGKKSSLNNKVDFDQCKIYLERLNKIIPKYISEDEDSVQEIV